ncbi:MAG: nitroreductase family protein [Sulfolobales archaeon]
MLRSKEILEIIGSRVSIRRFKQDPIPDEVLKTILWAATRAPTAGARENWFFVVIKSEELRKRVHELLIEAHVMYAKEIAKMSLDRIEKWKRSMEEGMYLAPVYIAVYIDLSRLSSGGTGKSSEAEFIMEIQSAAAAIENAILAAWSLGVGSVWLGVPLLIEEKFKELMSVPREYKLMGILALGYPLEVPNPRRRKPVDDVTKFI